MYTKQEIIIKCYKQGESLRKISRDLNISRKTVKKYLESYEYQLKETKSTESAQVLYFSDPPIYNSTNRSKVKLTHDVVSFIDSLLELNEKKRENGLRKQLLKKKDILQELHRHGFEIGYTSVCNYISSKSLTQRTPEAFIKQVYTPGSVCEFDWGEIKLFIAGKQVRFQLAVFTSAYSNYRLAYIYHRQDTLSFMESHVRFFRDTGGVYAQMVYDNMRVAVARFIGRNEKEPTQALLSLRGHYHFSHRFCNIYRGNEKGHVERSVEYVRRKAFAMVDSFDDVGQAQSHLETILAKINNEQQSLMSQTANSKFEDEKRVLIAHPPSQLICSEQVQLRVDKYSTVSFKTNRYSVPDHLIGNFIEVSVMSGELLFYSNNSKICTHLRSYDKHQWVINIEHYLSTFRKKPGALAGSLALAGNAYLKSLYLQYFASEPRDFIDLLSYCKTNSISGERMEDSVSRLLNDHRGQLTVEKLRAILGNNHHAQKPIKDDSICLMSKRQLTTVSELMY